MNVSIFPVKRTVSIDISVGLAGLSIETVRSSRGCHMIFMRDGLDGIIFL